MAERKETFMNLMTDFGFKRLFGTEEFKPILLRFLNILFQKEGLHVDEVVYHDKEALPPDPDGKRIVYDVYCTSVKEKDKEHFLVEMQQVYHTNFEKRVMYYLTRALASQGEKGGAYDLESVFGIFVLDFNFKHLHKRLLHDFRMMETETHQVFSNILRLLIVSLEETKPTWEECDTELEQITFIMKNMHLMDKNSSAYKSQEYKDMFDAAEINTMAAEDIVTYSQSKQKLKDMQLAYDYARSEGLEAGLAEGRAEGRAEGKSEGLKEGMERERITSIKIMHSMGIATERIAQVYNMPIEYVANIIDK